MYRRIYVRTTVHNKRFPWHLRSIIYRSGAGIIGEAHTALLYDIMRRDTNAIGRIIRVVNAGAEKTCNNNNNILYYRQIYIAKPHACVSQIILYYYAVKIIEPFVILCLEYNM